MHAQRLLLEGEFNQYYRMSMRGFERLLVYVGADLAVDRLRSERRARGEPPVSPASMHKQGWLLQNFKLCSSCYKSKLKLGIVFPESDEEMKYAAAGFRIQEVQFQGASAQLTDGYVLYKFQEGPTAAA
ncbi:LOW QUALITY PROTEIN: hypothetical protein PHMEG_0004828 [Phytophthora megakarya]|uniref:Uncharacterized protein n=1 Tax=Phytophthora megakarya TaxID=4795 RepID=A0A225WSS4_9STRA|nr:LOW QUALITY PROTEIN: hypothetical protein PHMEG_0004828 [Phytophthora megakarya]